MLSLSESKHNEYDIIDTPFGKQIIHIYIGVINVLIVTLMYDSMAKNIVKKIAFNLIHLFDETTFLVSNVLFQTPFALQETLITSFKGRMHPRWSHSRFYQREIGKNNQLKVVISNA